MLFSRPLNCYLALTKTTVPNAGTLFTVRAAGTSPLLLLGKVELDNVKSLSTHATQDRLSLQRLKERFSTSIVLSHRFRLSSSLLYGLFVQVHLLRVVVRA